jgi:hypothetical protein
MEYWEFLLQQEGDHHWLPLDTAQMEILEGRYRIMAHTSAANTPVRVQVSQRRRHQDPPKRRSFQRQGHTNDDGLMVVIPFTRLQAGTWDIRCSSLPRDGETASDADAAPPATPDSDWAYRVQLQVLPPGTGDDEAWVLPPEDMPAPVVTSAIPIAPAPDPLHVHLDLDRVAAALDEAQADLATGDALQRGPHRLHLTQTALLGQEGATADLSGHLTGSKTGESCVGMALVVRLVDPQTATAVALNPFPLPSPTLPADIHLTLTIPGNLETRLVLGELALMDATTLAVLALQRFTLTVDLADLFGTIANQAETETDYILDFAGGTGQTLAGGPRDEAFPSRSLDLPQGPPRSIPIFTRPPGKTPLPPKLYEPSPHEIGARQPTLPPFTPPRRANSSAPVADAMPVADPPISADMAPAASNLTAVPSPESGRDSAGAAPSTAADRNALSLPPLPTPDPPVASPPAVPLLVSHEVAEFRELNLQERFWSRLNAMAVSLQQEARERRNAPESEGGAHPRPASFTSSEPFAGEVVIYEDEDETLGGSVAAPGESATASPAVAPEDPVTPPAPDLAVPTGDLVAGEPVLLTLRVPFHPNRLYLRVWISDPQTRSLVDEPRQVMNLRPNGHGQLEGTVQVTAPLGCLEADFEAISVDMMTQQESYKATVRRSVIPPGLETPNLDEFEI